MAEGRTSKGEGTDYKFRPLFGFFCPEGEKRVTPKVFAAYHLEPPSKIVKLRRH